MNIYEPIISGSAYFNGPAFFSQTINATSSFAVSASYLIGGGGGINLLDTQTYSNTGSFTWTKPVGAKFLQIILTGGGGGGASGAAAVGSGVAGGAGGGGGAGTVIQILPAASFGDTVSVFVGAGGIGGTANSRTGAGANATTAGVNGSNGENSVFGYLVAEGGLSGSYTAANNAVGVGGAPATIPVSTFNATTGVYTVDPWTAPIAISGPGGSGAATDKSPAAVPALDMSSSVATGGGYGGTPGNTTANENGGAGGATIGSSGSIISGGIGSFDGIFAIAPAGEGNLAGSWWGTGGGGGYGVYTASGAATATNGANGSIGAGGGGGGSARNNTNTNPNTANSGAGGRGGNGIVIVYTYG
jgi:hypothetical protein